MINLVKELCLINGVSGLENDVANSIVSKIKNCANVKIDNCGNVIAFKKGKKTPKQKIMLSAHMDEVGFIVTNIEDNGFIHFTTCGAIDPRVVIGKSVTVGKDNTVGVIGTKAIHMKVGDERDKTAKLKDVYIDIGAKNKEEASKYVRLGDRASFRTDFVEFGDNLVRGKALDNRAGCAVLIDLLQNFDEFDYYCAFTVQEETGATGGKTAANAIDPDIAVIVETTPAGDIPGCSQEACRLGDGAVIYFKDKGTIYDHQIYTLLMDKAEELKIPHQAKTAITGVNESRFVQTANGGVKVAAIATPCRYAHSASCVINKNDLESVCKLIKETLPVLAEF